MNQRGPDDHEVERQMCAAAGHRLVDEARCQCGRIDLAALDPILLAVQSTVTIGLAGETRAGVFADAGADPDSGALTDPVWNRRLLSGVAGSIAAIVRVGMPPDIDGKQFGFDLVSTSGHEDPVEARRATTIAQLMTTIMNDDPDTHDAVVAAVPDDEVGDVLDLALGFLRPTLLATVARCAIPGTEREIVTGFTATLCGPFASSQLVDSIVESLVGGGA